MGWADRLRRLGRASGEAPRDGHSVAYYAFLFSTVLFTGFYHLFSSSWSPFFRFDLVLHPLLGAIATGTIIVSLFQRVRVDVPALGPSHLVTFVLMCFVALARAFTLQHLPELVSNYLTWILTPLLVGSTIYFFVKTLPLIPQLSRVRHGWSHLALISLWVLAFLLGVLILGNAFRGRVPTWIRALHSALGYVAAAVGFWVLARPARARLRGSGFQAGVAFAALALVVVGVVVDGVARVVRPIPRLPPVTVHLSAIPFERREPGDRDALPFAVDASWLQISRSCAGAGCHEGLFDDFRHSLHATSTRTPHVQKVLALVTDELGAHNRATCGGCHVPAALFDGGPSDLASRDRDDMSCVFCHSISQVSIDDHERSSYTLSLHGEHLASFRRAEIEGEDLGVLDRASIHLNPRSHARVFRRSLYRENRYCLSCHHTQLRSAVANPPDEASAATSDSLTCIDCHMEPRTVFGEPGGHVGATSAARNHYFPGSSTTVPTILGFDDYARLTERWMRGDFLVRSFEDLYRKRDHVRPTGEARKGGFLYAEVSSSFSSPPRAGESTELSVTTRNVAMGHAFPSSSLDLQEAWLEVRVTDASGLEVMSSGGVDANQALLPDTHTLGGRLLDAEGRPIDRYRIWDTAREVIDRQIPFRGEVVDRFSLTVPASARSHLNVEASWRYRKLGHAFWSWAYPEGGPIPSPVVVRHFTQYPLEPAAAAAPEPGSPS